MNLYPGKKVFYNNLPDIWMLEKANLNSLGFWHCVKRNGDKGLWHQDKLTPVLKIGDTVEAKVGTSNHYDGIYTLVNETVTKYPNSQTLLTNYCWVCANDHRKHEIHETWLWPIKAIESNSCTCNITDLMRYGCKCGQIQREKA